MANAIARLLRIHGSLQRLARSSSPAPNHLHICAIISMCWRCISGDMERICGFIIASRSAGLFALIMFLCMSHMVFISIMPIWPICPIWPPLDASDGAAEVVALGWCASCSASMPGSPLPGVAQAASKPARTIGMSRWSNVERCFMTIFLL